MQTLKSTQAMADAMMGATKVRSQPCLAHALARAPAATAQQRRGLGACALMLAGQQRGCTHGRGILQLCKAGNVRSTHAWTPV